MQKTAIWRTTRCIALDKIPAKLREFLFDTGSTTRRMQCDYAAQTQVVSLKQYWDYPDQQEALVLNISKRRYAYIRETYLSAQNKIWMYARAIFPRDFFVGKNRRLYKQLNQRPLGQLLFKGAVLRRSPFEFVLLTPKHLEYQYAAQQYPISDAVWARRSVFWLQEKPLLLMEIFLPGFFELVKKHKRVS